MIQYNLRLDETVKEKASSFAKKRGLSENSFYQMAIEEFLVKEEMSEFYQKLNKRIVTPEQKKKILSKLSANKGKVLYKEDE